MLGYQRANTKQIRGMTHLTYWYSLRGGGGGSVLTPAGRDRLQVVPNPIQVTLQPHTHTHTHTQLLRGLVTNV